MRRPYRSTKWRRWWLENRWDLLAYVVAFLVLACLLWPAWKGTVPRHLGPEGAAGEAMAPTAVEEEPMQQARPPPGKCRMTNAK